MLAVRVTSIMDNGWEWHARTALPKVSGGGEFLFENAERCDSEEWHRWTPESNSCSSPPILLDSFHVLSCDWQADWVPEVALLDVTSGTEASSNLCLGVVTGVFNLSSWLDGETEDICWSNAFRYKERRYCSKYTTSSSNTAISLINSVAGCGYRNTWSSKSKTFESDINISK